MRRAQDRARSWRSRKNGARSATIKSRALGALKLASEAHDENVPAKWADFFLFFPVLYLASAAAKLNRRVRPLVTRSLLRGLCKSCKLQKFKHDLVPQY